MALVLTGCSGSRWAQRDPDYTEKYAEHTEDPARVVKQAVDARHVEHKGGSYIHAGVAPFDEAYLLSGGGFGYPTAWFEQRIGLSALASETIEDRLFLGVEGGLRVQSPSRFAPFVGIGGYAGPSLAAWLEDDDSDYVLPSEGEEDHNALAAIYPEIGFHLWQNADKRWTFSASYWLTTEGRNEDFLMFNLSMSRLDLDSKPSIDELEDDDDEWNFHSKEFGR